MTTYKEQLKNRKSYVLIQDRIVLGVFGNLTKLCKFMEGKDFQSYHTLTRKDLTNYQFKNYSIQKVRHY